MCTTKKINLIFLSSVLFIASVAFADISRVKFKQDKVINVISYSEFKPISYGKAQGYEADILKAIAKRWHMKIKFHPESNYDDLWLLPSKTYTIADISIGGFTPIDERMKEGAKFSKMTLYFDQSLLVRKKDYESGRITSYKSFKDAAMKIGVVPYTTGEKYACAQAKENGVSTSVIEHYASESALLPALEKGEIDAIARGEIGNEFEEKIHPEFITIAKRNFHEGFAFAVDKDNPALMEALNQAIDQVTHHGKVGYIQWLKNPNVFLLDSL